MKRLYEVEWISKQPEDEWGEPDVDNAEYETRRFPSHALALAFTRKILATGIPWGQAFIRPVEKITMEQARHEDESWREGYRWFVYRGEREEVTC